MHGLEDTIRRDGDRESQRQAAKPALSVPETNTTASLASEGVRSEMEEVVPGTAPHWSATKTKTIPKEHWE
jgi:hypothetical protein